MNTCKTCGKQTDMPWNWTAADECPDCGKPPSKISMASGGAPKIGVQRHAGGEDFRTVKATVPAIEFGVIQWAAKRAGGGHKAQRLDVFMRLALLDRIREVVKGEIARGKSVPPDIAAIISNYK